MVLFDDHPLPHHAERGDEGTNLVLDSDLVIPAGKSLIVEIPRS
jgi:hypothetical protein